jgi:hypothetical protein
MSPYEAGAAARAAQEPSDANPYPESTGTVFRRREWYRGWSEWRNERDHNAKRPPEPKPERPVL